MKNAWNKKLWTATAMTAAIDSRMTASTQKGRGGLRFFGVLDDDGPDLPALVRR